MALLLVLRQELGRGHEHRAGQAGVGVRAGLLHREPAEPVRQCLGHAPEPLFDPAGLGERTVRGDGDGFAAGVDLAGLFPMAADGAVVQPGVVSRHLTRGMIKKDLDDLLRDVTVDQAGREGMTPLVGCQMNGPAVLVADVAALQPVVQLAAVGVGGQLPGAVGIHPRCGEQPPAAVRPAIQDPLLLPGDLLVEFLVDGNERFTLHLVIEVAQVRRPIGITDDALRPDLGGVADPEPAAHQDLGE